jgi:hypothetical protein
MTLFQSSISYCAFAADLSSCCPCQSEFGGDNCQLDLQLFCLAAVSAVDGNSICIGFISHLLWICRLIICICGYAGARDQGQIHGRNPSFRILYCA